MDLTFVKLNNGMVGVVVPKEQRIRVVAARSQRNGSAARRITEFSRKSANRFRARLWRTDFNLEATFAVTLVAARGVDPKEAKNQFARWVRWLRVRYPKAFGFYSLEFASGECVHFHVIVSLFERGYCHPLEGYDDMLESWAGFSVQPVGDGFYLDVVHDLGGYLKYLAKCDHQRAIPQQFRGGPSVRFWGRIGKPRERAGQSVKVRPDAEQNVRGALADLIVEGEHARAFAYSEAIRHSTSDLLVYVTDEQAAKFAADIGVREAA